MRKRSTPNKARTERKECGIIRGWLLWPRGSTAPPPGPPPEAMGSGRPSHATRGLVCVTGRARQRRCVATGDRRPARGLWNHSSWGQGPPCSTAQGPRGTRVRKAHAHGLHQRPLDHGAEDNVTRLRGTVSVHERQRESLHVSTENRKIKFKMPFTLLICGIVKKESHSSKQGRARQGRGLGTGGSRSARGSDTQIREECGLRMGPDTRGP